VISGSEVRSGSDEEGSGGESDSESDGSSPGTDGGESDGPSDGGRGSGAQGDTDGNDGKNPDDHTDRDDDDHGHRADPTPEEFQAAQAHLVEVYRNAQDASIAELQRSDPVRPLHSYLMLPLHVDLKLTPPPTQQGASRASPAGVVEISPESSPLSAAPATAPQSPMSNSSRGPPSSPGSPFAFQALFLPPRQSPQQSTTQTQTTPQQQQPTAQKRKRKQPVGKSSPLLPAYCHSSPALTIFSEMTAAMERPRRQRKTVQYKF
jgi:hypothetical protein